MKVRNILATQKCDYKEPKHKNLAPTKTRECPNRYKGVTAREIAQRHSANGQYTAKRGEKQTSSKRKHSQNTANKADTGPQPR